MDFIPVEALKNPGGILISAVVALISVPSGQILPAAHETEFVPTFPASTGVQPAKEC